MNQGRQDKLLGRLLLHLLIGLTILNLFSGKAAEGAEEVGEVHTLRGAVPAGFEEFEQPQAKQQQPPVQSEQKPVSKWRGGVGMCDVRTDEGLARCNEAQRAFYNRLIISSEEAVLLHQYQLEQMLIMSRGDAQVRSHMKKSSAIYDWFMLRIRVW